MNKKGFILNYLFIFILIITAVTLLAIESGADRYSAISAVMKLDWDKSMSLSINKSFYDAKVGISRDNSFLIPILNILERGINFLGYSTIETTKIVASFAADKPEYFNAEVIILLIILFLIAPLIYPLFMVIVSIILIVREWLQNRKEKKNQDYYG